MHDGKGKFSRWHSTWLRTSSFTVTPPIFLRTSRVLRRCRRRGCDVVAFLGASNLKGYLPRPAQSWVQQIGIGAQVYVVVVVLVIVLTTLEYLDLPGDI